MGARPLVSAIVSTYNAERFIAACLDDLEAQTISDRIEIIVIDSGSQQGERAIVERYQRRFGNILYRRTKRETLYAAWNRGIRLARGRYVTNANTDDAHRADALELLSSALDAYPQADLAYGDYEWTSVPNDTFADPHGYRVARHPPYHPAQAMFFCVTGCHPMWRRRVFERIGWFDPTFVAPGDFEFFMRFAAAGLRAVHVPEVLSLFFQNRAGLTFTSALKEIRRLYPTYRTRTPIQRLYRVDPRRPAAVARAWVAQGNLAMSCALPYGDAAVTDWPYAQYCYGRALASDPTCVPALRNLIVGSVRYGPTKTLLDLLTRLPSTARDELRADMRAGRLRLLAVDVPPAVAPLEFAHGRSLLVPAAAPAFVELAGLSAATRALARRVSGAATSLSRSRRIGDLDRELRRLGSLLRAERRRPSPGRRRTMARIASAIAARRRLRETLRALSAARSRSARLALTPVLSTASTVSTAADGSVVWDASRGRVHYLNRTAALIVELCSGENSWGRIADLVQAAYGLRDRPEREVGRVLTALLDDGALEVRRPRSRAAVAGRSRARAP